MNALSRGGGRRASGPREGEDLRHAGLRLPPDHGRAAAQAPLRDHRRHPRGPGIVKAAGQVGRTRRLCLCCARPARHGVVDEEGSARPPCSRRPDPAARSGRARRPYQKAIWSAVSVSDPEGEVQKSKDGSPEPDPDLRDYENVPLDEDIDAYFAREVTPHVPDAWIDHSKTKIGYEIPFTRHFYVYTPPRPLAEIDAELRDLEVPDPEAPRRGDGMSRTSAAQVEWPERLAERTAVGQSTGKDEDTRRGACPCVYRASLVSSNARVELATITESDRRRSSSIYQLSSRRVIWL